MDSVYKYASPSTCRQSNVILHVAQTQNRLLRPHTKNLFRSTGINFLPLCDLLEIFSPTEGTVVDAYAGSFPRGLSVLRLKRKYIIMDSDVCIAAETKRLEIAAQAMMLTRSMTYGRGSLRKCNGNSELESLRPPKMPRVNNSENDEDVPDSYEGCYKEP